MSEYPLADSPDPAVRRLAKIAGDTIPALVLIKLAKADGEILLSRKEAAALVCMFEYLMRQIGDERMKR